MIGTVLSGMRILTTMFLLFAGGFFLHSTWKDRGNTSHMTGNFVSAFFLLLAVFLIWWR